MSVTHHHGTNSGFTVIELAVVISISTILMVLLVPTLSSARTNAKTTQGLANLHQIGHGIHIHAVDHKSTLPIGSDPTGFGSDWSIVLNSSMAGSGDNYNTVDVDSNGVPQTLPIFRDPNASYPHQGFLHYSSHPVLMPDIANTTNPSVGWTRYKLARIQRPSEVILIMDGIQNPTHSTVPYTAFATTKDLDNGSLHPFEGDPLKEYFDSTDIDNDDTINAGPNDDVSNVGDIRWRQHHNTAANVAFPDGHSSTIRIGEIKKRNIRVDP